MEFSEKMCLIIILEVTKNQGFALFLENTVSEKPAFLELRKRYGCDLAKEIRTNILYKK